MESRWFKSFRKLKKNKTKKDSVVPLCLSRCTLGCGSSANYYLSVLKKVAKGGRNSDQQWSRSCKGGAQLARVCLQLSHGACGKMCSVLLRVALFYLVL